MSTRGETILGSTPLQHEEQTVSGSYTTLEGEDFFVIRHYDQMRPFFMTIVSASDHWLFISSNGALSAGRRNPEQSLFPYYTDDKITDSVGLTGAKTIFRVNTEQGVCLWEPFATHYHGLYKTTHQLYKNREGNKIVFEETNEDLGLIFRYAWMFSDQYGIVKKSYLINIGEDAQEIDLLDGVQNMLPYGVESALQMGRSTLVDAYKRAELDPSTGLAMYSLSSMIVDKAEPSEALKATTAWAAGIDYETILLSSLQLKAYRQRGAVEPELDIKAEKGAFFIKSNLMLPADSVKSWMIVCEVSQSGTDIATLREQLGDRNKMFDLVNADVYQNKQDLRKKIGMTDGIQLSKDRLSTGRHFSNVLFNIMRGGTFDDQYQVETADFIDHIKTMNRPGYSRLRRVLQALPEYISYHQLRYFLSAAKHQDVLRYYLEYLPLSFSRRHGDPSRPWNYFSIETQDEEGKKLRNFEGNWRDIFQNWEALAFSYPEYALGMIAKFVNASTIDGYNPYRITREGIDWEIIEPNDPWSHIGYWGDHQVIYLTKLLEISLAYHPQRLNKMLTSKIYTYANVPYRIKGYDAIASNPKDTIDFDHQLADLVARRVEQVGSDGKLVWNKNEELELVNLTEKLLVMVLTKLYNLIPEAGIWLNTQRPEWNDANNALVGNGVSMVTLYYLRRLLSLSKRLYRDLETDAIEINKPVVDLMEALRRGFNMYQEGLEERFSDEARRQFMDDFGVAGEHYRTTAYAGFTGQKRQLQVTDMLQFFDLSRSFLERAIDLNQRPDGLYQSYNLVTLSDGKAEVEHLYEMLEGQVAVLSAGYLNGDEAVQVLNALRSSAMFRPDQYSYMLYPDRELPPFLQKNTVDPASLRNSRLLDALLSSKNRNIIEKDVDGKLHFNGEFHHANDLEKALDRIKDVDLERLVKKERGLFLSAFEKTFNHKSFTGRSGAFYGYEGLGSIYWHMVSKLLLSIQENIIMAHEAGDNAITMGHLIEHYYEIRAGIGVNKSPDLYGAFPTDAYSHTPKYAGAKQPGMTGQVKEDIINRWAELGVLAREGCLSFRPLILRSEEFQEEDATLSYYDYNGEACKIAVPAGAMAFTYCQIPIVYRITSESGMRIQYADGTSVEQAEATMNAADSKEIFQRSGRVESVEVKLTKAQLC